MTKPPYPTASLRDYPVSGTGALQMTETGQFCSSHAHGCRDPVHCASVGRCIDRRSFCRPDKMCAVGESCRILDCPWRAVGREPDEVWWLAVALLGV